MMAISDISDIILDKDDVFIARIDNNFVLNIPIPAKLLSQEIVFDKELAKSVFFTAANDYWYPEICKYYRKLKNGDAWKYVYEKFCNIKPGLLDNNDGSRKIVPANYYDWVILDQKTNFARGFSINESVIALISSSKDSKNDPREYSKQVIKNYLNKKNFPQERVEKFGNFLTMYKLLKPSPDYSAVLFMKYWIILYLNKAVESLDSML